MLSIEKPIYSSKFVDDNNENIYLITYYHESNIVTEINRNGIITTIEAHIQPDMQEASGALKGILITHACEVNSLIGLMRADRYIDVTDHVTAIISALQQATSPEPPTTEDLQIFGFITRDKNESIVNVFTILGKDGLNTIIGREQSETTIPYIVDTTTTDTTTTNTNNNKIDLFSMANISRHLKEINEYLSMFGCVNKVTQEEFIPDILHQLTSYTLSKMHESKQINYNDLYNEKPF